MSSVTNTTGTTILLQYQDSKGVNHNLPFPLQTQAFRINTPAFPIQFLKGTPLFWDDFESGPAGFIMPERALALQTGNTGPTALGGGRWNLRDGNEYGAYITGEASASGRRSLFTGGNPTTQTYGDIGNQDVSCDVPIASGIVGLEFSLLCKAISNPGAHMISIEDKDPADATRFRELQMSVYFHVSSPPQVLLFSSQGTSTILSATIKDSNGLTLPGLTYPGIGGGTNFVRGSTGSWHRVGFVVDMNLGKFLAVYLDKYYISSTTLSIIGSSLWKITNPDPAAHSLQDGLKRIEFHSLTNGSSFAPQFYHDDVVVTDESGSVYT